jgi:hypothetical protein
MEHKASQHDSLLSISAAWQDWTRAASGASRRRTVSSSISLGIPNGVHGDAGRCALNVSYTSATLVGPPHKATETQLSRICAPCPRYRRTSGGTSP